MRTDINLIEALDTHPEEEIEFSFVESTTLSELQRDSLMLYCIEQSGVPQDVMDKALKLFNDLKETLD